MKLKIFNRENKDMPYSYPQLRNNKKKKINYLKKIFICLVIFTVALGLHKINLPVTRKAADGIKYLLTYDYDFHKAVEDSRILSFLNEKIKPEVLKMVFNQSSPPLLKEDVDLPVQGEISSGFGIRIHPVLKEKRQHNGIDIRASEGEPIRVILDGKVKKVREDKELGNTVLIDHGDGIETLYAHCSEILVNEGDKVIKNQVIARVGDTGLADGTHLHFEVWVNGKPVDPVSTLFKNLNKTDQR